MNADAIIERLERLRANASKYDQEVEEDVFLPCWAVSIADLDAAIADIRDYLQEPVRVWVGTVTTHHSYVGDDVGIRKAFLSAEAADRWLMAGGNEYRDTVELVVDPDAPKEADDAR